MNFTSNNAPVTRVSWACNNLPEGLTLSSTGILSGCPAILGTFVCDVLVTTNWGTSTKVIRIKVEVPENWKPAIENGQIIEVKADEKMTDYAVKGSNVIRRGHIND